MYFFIHLHMNAYNTCIYPNRHLYIMYSHTCMTHRYINTEIDPSIHPSIHTSRLSCIHKEDSHPPRIPSPIFFFLLYISARIFERHLRRVRPIGGRTHWGKPASKVWNSQNFCDCRSRRYNHPSPLCYILGFTPSCYVP